MGTWSASTPETLEDAEAINAGAFSTSPSKLGDLPRQQFMAAVDAAKAMSAHVEGPIRVSASGHAKEDSGGGELEHATVSISQVKVPEAD